MIPIGFIAEMETIAPIGMRERFGVEYAKTCLQKTIGLMFRKDCIGKMIFTFKKPASIYIHTFFMRFPVDISCYNEKYENIREVKNMKPWRVVVVKDVKLLAEQKSG